MHYFDFSISFCYISVFVVVTILNKLRGRKVEKGQFV